MKALNNTLIIVSILFLSIMVGCKKKDAVPDVVTPGIAASELLDYYIVAEFKTGLNNRLMTMHFTQEGNTIKVHGHLQQGYQVREIVVKNNTFTVDFFGDGKSIYTFMIEKNEAGKLKLKSYSFSFIGQENELDYALLINKPGIGITYNSYYMMIERSVPLSNLKDGLLIAINETSMLIIATNKTIPFYKYMDIGYKSNDGKYMLVTVPHWKGIDAPIVLIEFDDLLLIAKN